MINIENIDSESIDNWLTKHKPLKLLQEAIQCNTINPPGNVMNLVYILEKVFQTYDIETKVYKNEEEKANLVAKIRGCEKGKRLLFSGHLDTVKVGETIWEHSPFSGDINDGKMFGRGSSDMKSGLIALIYAMIFCKTTDALKKGELVFVATFDEEIGSIGAQQLIKEGLIEDFDAMIIGEPTDNQIVTSHKGALWVRVDSIGKTAHGSMPDKGINAIDGMKSFIDNLREIPLFKENSDNDLLTRSTMAVTTIKSGTNPNVIPDYCTSTIDFRITPDYRNSNLLTMLCDYASDFSKKENATQITINPIVNLDPLNTEAESEIVQITKDIFSERYKINKTPMRMNYFTDGSVFSTFSDGEIIILGPGNPNQAHQPNEYVEIDKFFQSIEVYISIAIKYLNRSSLDAEKSITNKTI